MISEELIAKAAFEVDQAILNTLPEPCECNHEFSPSFERKIQKLSRKIKHLAAHTVLKRVACIFITITLLTSMILMLNPTARAAVAAWVKEQVYEFYHYFFIEEETPVSETQNENAETAPPEELKTYYLGWVPDGYVLMDWVETNSGKTLIYVNEAAAIIQFHYRLGSDTTSVFAGVGEYEHRYVTSGDFQGELYFALDENQTNGIVWMSEERDTIFSITGDLTEQELVKAALFVRPGKP